MGICRDGKIFCNAQQYDGIFATGKEQCRIGTLGRDFTHDVDRFRFQPIQMAIAGGVQK